jgi:hypothetical protein
MPCYSSMTADLACGCYSTVSDYKNTEGCSNEIPATDISILTKTIIVEGTTSEHLENIVAAMQPISVMTRMFSLSETSQLVAVSVLPMLSLVHQQSDLLRAVSNMAASTSNSAGRATPNTNTWGRVGFHSVFSVVLTVAVVFQ